jgi:hypothetical protein
MRSVFVSAVSLAFALAPAAPAGAQEQCGPFRREGNVIMANRITEAIPGIGGYHWDNQCNFVVLLTDTTYADLARVCFTELLPTAERYRGNQCTAEPAVRILPAKFDYDDLALARSLIWTISREAQAGMGFSIDDSTQAFHVYVKNERARANVEEGIRNESRLAPYSIVVDLKAPELRELDVPSPPPGSAYTAAIWHLKTVFETRINGSPAYSGRRLRLQCVTFTEGAVPESLREIDLTPLGLWFGDCGRGQTIRFGGVRGFESGAFGIQTSLAGWCGEVRVDPRLGGWSADYRVSECGVTGVRNPRRSELPTEAAAYDEIVRLELLSADSADVLPKPVAADGRGQMWPDEVKLVPTTDSVFYLLRKEEQSSELWARRPAPPVGLDSLAFRIERPFHYVTTVGQRAYVLDLPAGNIVVFDTAGQQVASRQLPVDLADTLRSSISFHGRPQGYTLSLSVASFRAESGKLVVDGRRFIMIDPETLGITTIGGPWRRFLFGFGGQRAIRGDTLLTLSRFDRLIEYRMVPVPDDVPLVQPEFPAF